MVEMASYLASLEMKAQVAAADDVSLPRIAQLVAKSNQFHLTGMRLAEPELRAYAARPGHHVLGFRLADRFGDNGLVSAVALRRESGELHVDIWVMSCRVLGRTMEELVANEILRTARESGCGAVVGRYVPSPKNALVSGLYARLGFEPDGDAWRVPVEGPMPRWETRVAYHGVIRKEPVGIP
jgi:FkbH-like protein